MNEYAQTERTRIHRVAKRAAYDKPTIHAILDEALVAHVGFIDADQPYVLPMVFVRMDDAIYLHGSTRARMLEAITAGAPVCATVTHLDGLVLARSAFHHSVNYRSVAIIGCGRAVTDDAEAMAALEALTEKTVPGRWSHVRLPNEKEMKATRVVAIPIEEVSAKVRTGPPVDEKEDLDLGIWAGSIPIVSTFGEPAVDTPEIEMPAYVREMIK